MNYFRTQQLLAVLAIILCGVQNLAAVLTLGAVMLLIAIAHNFTH